MIIKCVLIVGDRRAPGREPHNSAVTSADILRLWGMASARREAVL